MTKVIKIVIDIEGNVNVIVIEIVIDIEGTFIVNVIVIDIECNVNIIVIVIVIIIAKCNCTQAWSRIYVVSQYCQ